MRLGLIGRGAIGEAVIADVDQGANPKTGTLVAMALVKTVRALVSPRLTLSRTK
jgi:hypothetical protein